MDTNPLVGRAAELARLADPMLAGRGGVVLVSGEPGIGKTRLLREFAGVAEEHGRPVAFGRATEFESELPFAMFVDALGGALSRIDPAALGAERQRLVASVFGGLDERPTFMDVERFRVYRVMRALIEQLAEPSGLVLVLDDVHWADRASIELAEYLMRRPPGGDVVLAMAYRPRQLPVRMRASVSRDRADVIELGPLTVDDVSALLPGHSAEERQRLHAASNGNPLYLQALARTRERPESVRAALAAELRALSPLLAVVAHAAAVVGDVVDADVVAEVAEVDPATALTAIDELVRRDVLRSAGPQRLAFRHPILREAAYESAGAGWRAAAHRRAMTAGAKRGAPAATRAHHAIRAGDRDAVDLLVSVARANLHTAPAAAAHWLRAALDLHPADPFALLGLLGRALAVTGQLREARDVVHQVLRMLPPSEVEARAQTISLAAMLERLLGNHTEARAMLVAELESVPEHSVAAGVLRLGLASARLMGSGFDDEPWADEAIATARKLDDRPLLAASLGMWVASIGLTGDDPDRQASHLAEAAGLVDALTDGELVRYLDAVVYTGWAEVIAERLTDGARHLERGLRLARETGQNHVVTYLLIGLGMAYALRGRLAEAQECFTDAVDAATLAGSEELRVMALSNQCWVATWQGDLDAALAIGAESVATAQPGTAWFGSVAHAMYAQAIFYGGDVDGAVERLLSTCGGAELDQIHPMFRMNWYEFLANAEATRDRPVEAQRWADRSTALALTFPLPMRTAMSELAQAHAALDADPLRATRHAADAAAAFDAGGNLVDAGRAHHVAALAHGRAGDLDAARERFHLARRRFTDSGAQWLLARVIREERRMNARGPRRGQPAVTTGDIEGLTARERQIAELVALGRSNREIAEQLFITVRTVESHVARILTQLAVPNRAALAYKLTHGKPR